VVQQSIETNASNKRWQHQTQGLLKFNLGGAFNLKCVLARRAAGGDVTFLQLTSDSECQH